MQLIWSAMGRGRLYAFPAVWLAVLAVGAGLREPTAPVDASSFLAFDGDTKQAMILPPFDIAEMDLDPAGLVFVRNDTQPDEARPFGARDLGGFQVAGGGGHGRFAAPGNAARRIQMRAVTPRTADELAGFFRDVSYSLSDIRQGEAVPPIKLVRVPEDLGSKDGNERKALFITALLPVVLEVNHQVFAERMQLVDLRDKLRDGGRLLPAERIWLEQLAERYETPVDKLDELLRRVDIVPPSMAIAQSGVESGWGTSFAARTGNALFGQIQAVGRHNVSVPWQPGAGMPQPFRSVGEAAEAYVNNLNTHPAYAAFRAERAAMRERGEQPTGYHLIGQLLRYSELGQTYVGFVRLIMRENKLSDFDGARLSMN